MSPTITTRTLWTLDVDRLLETGAMEGPYTVARPDGPSIKPNAVVGAADRLREFLSVFRLYAKHHSPAYADRIAWAVAVNKTPF